MARSDRASPVPRIILKTPEIDEIIIDCTTVVFHSAEVDITIVAYVGIYGSQAEWAAPKLLHREENFHDDPPDTPISNFSLAVESFANK